MKLLLLYFYYYDAETGCYYANGRYYDPETGLYIDSDDPENISSNATVIGGLDRNAITLDKYITVESNPYNIFTLDDLTADITYDWDENVSWWERNWANVLRLCKIQRQIASFGSFFLDFCR